MKHVVALIIKFVMVAVILEIILSMWSNLMFSEIFVISLTLTVLAYILGDLLILPISNNTVATVADAILALVVIYAFNYVYTDRIIPLSATVVSAIVLAIGEWFFHRYMASRVFPERREG